MVYIVLNLWLALSLLEKHMKVLRQPFNEVRLIKLVSQSFDKS